MYVKDFAMFLFDVLAESLNFLGEIGSIGINCANSLLNVVTALPAWIYMPFYALISIAILFRVSQFIPTIGGAS